MAFNSTQFVVFFCVVWGIVGVLATLGRRSRESTWIGVRNGFLLTVSYVFYGAWDWRFLGLIVLSTVVDYFCALGMSSLGPGREGAPVGSAAPAAVGRRRKALLLVSLCTNLSLLGFFKYFGFFVQSAVDTLTGLGIAASVPSLSVALPVGISFYTFQTLSYTIDVYRGRVEPERNPVCFATYVAFFPQLVAGPIERADSLLPQFRAPTRVDLEAFYGGCHLICAGLFKKVVIADNVGKVADAGYALQQPDGLQTLVATYAFAVQVYCDFSGYTDIARGAARCLGFNLTLNFNLPFTAQNPSDFWRRWHISFSTWLRDYLYVPLGGNRQGTRRMYVNLFLTMVLGGLWHGAAWTYVAWGAFHGVILCIYRMLTPWFERRFRVPGGAVGTAVRFVNGVFFFQLFCSSLVLFRAESLPHAWVMIQSLGGILDVDLSSLDGVGPVALGAVVTAPLVAVQALQRITGDLSVVRRLPAPARAVSYFVGAVMFLYLGEFGERAFIYFQF